jgi:succinate dehydrogenase/fumarate reductase flavoprotein subunit
MAEGKRTTRRQFLKGATAVGAGVAATGVLGGSAVAAPRSALVPGESRDLETEVLVVGLGFAGLVAAARAAEMGAKVIAIEKLPKGFWAPGGSFVISGQLIMQPPKPYAQMVAAVGMETIQWAMRWLSDVGVELGNECNVPDCPGGTALPPKDFATSSFIWRYLKPGGKYDATNYGGKKASLLLEEKIIKEGGEVLYETEAKKLLTDENGAVVGVLAKDKEGPFNIMAKATILCTGGFGRNEEMVAKYICNPCRDYVNATQCSPGATGDGLRMAMEIGAGASGFGWIYAWMAPAIAADEPMHDLSGYLKLDSLKVGIIVTENGERYCDESLGRHIYGTLLVKQQVRKIAFYIIDQAIYETLKPIVDELIEFGKEYKADTVYQADTIEELAKKAGINPYLATTVAEFNQAVDEDRTEQMRVPRTKPYSKLATPPFYAIPFVMGSNKTYGGLDLDRNARVLDTNGVPIPGLFAAGEVAFASRVAGVPDRPYNIDYISMGGGTGNLDNCLVFGLVAAETAAAYVKEM